jgi:hypothetical protein
MTWLGSTPRHRHAEDVTFSGSLSTAEMNAA